MILITLNAREIWIVSLNTVSHPSLLLMTVTNAHKDNSRPNTNIKQRQDSPIIGLKSFNNWIKSVIIAMWGAPALSGDSDTAANASRRSLTKGKVLDLGCGKGGDLQKWQKARVKLYCGLDIAETSVFQARDRASSLRAASGFTAVFNTLDCYSHPISRVLDKEMLSRPFDVVSMQFCMHYAFESVSKVRMMLENVARYLRVGGRFVGTIPNASLLMSVLLSSFLKPFIHQANREQLDGMSPESDLSFGNTVYKITFEDKKHSLFGQRYHFFLLDAVEDVPEYVVHWDNFVQLAQEHNLHLIERKEFHDIFMDQREHRDYGALLKKMRVVDDEGESQMDEDQWEAASEYLSPILFIRVFFDSGYIDLYIGFAFEKR
jgi:mRNA (guanine-N7-)-methyltransferase